MNSGKYVFEKGTPQDIWTHWGRVTHIWVSNLNTNGSYDGLSLDQREAII